jgi:hypothetical protein
MHANSSVFAYVYSSQFAEQNLRANYGTMLEIRSGYLLDDPAIEVRSLAEARGFFL